VWFGLGRFVMMLPHHQLQRNAPSVFANGGLKLIAETAIKFQKHQTTGHSPNAFPALYRRRLLCNTQSGY
jgi:hypothetical protein